MLTKQQINILFQYCDYKGVHYYDVQTELVDHLAGIIEKLQEEQPSLSLRDLIWQADGAFSPEEFKDIVESKSVSVRGRYRVLFKKELLSYFTIPGISLLVFLYVMLIYIRDLISKDISSCLASIFYFFMPLSLSLLGKKD